MNYLISSTQVGLHSPAALLILTCLGLAAIALLRWLAPKFLHLMHRQHFITFSDQLPEEEIYGQTKESPARIDWTEIPC